MVTYLLDDIPTGDIYNPQQISLKKFLDILMYSLSHNRTITSIIKREETVDALRCLIGHEFQVNRDPEEIDPMIADNILVIRVLEGADLRCYKLNENHFECFSVGPRPSRRYS